MFCLLLMLTASIANAQAVNDAPPCLNSEPACVEQLTTRAVNSSGEIRLLDETIRLARRRQWTNYLAADSFNIIGSLLRLGRNIAGGGDIQQSRIAVRALELRRSEVITNLRSQITELLRQIETAERKKNQAQTLLETQRSLVAILEVGYRSGDLSTERMIPAWEKLNNFRVEIQTAEAERNAALQNLLLLISPRR